MVFSSISFIYYFLPVILIIYFSVPKPLKNMVLLVGSLIFYAFSEPVYVLLLLFSSLVDFIHGIIIENNRGNKKAKRALISSIVINIALLAFFKYSDFIILNINTIFDMNIHSLGLRLPVGISFYTFQTMSYTIDVYRGQAKVQRNLLKLATYVSLFPQLIAGPIVRYRDIQEQIDSRESSYDLFAGGISRFVIGLSKKVILANTLGELSVLISNTGSPSVIFYWMGAIAFTLQIYFDFSGYSDMAIGLGRMFGFKFMENFNYPYISKSITEFWRRWHMSLSSWFRDYVYIPLGGNRGTKISWLRNILIVWLLTGLWHGASWNFIIWGLFFGLILVLEKVFLLKILEKTPGVFNHIYVIFLVIISFVIFNSDNLCSAFLNLKGMFGFLDIPFINRETVYYLRSYLGFFIVAFAGTTPMMKMGFDRLKKRGTWKIMEFIQPAGLLTLMIIVTGYIVDSSFNPFLYFRF
ncbi:MAG: MBOAT family protein [Clostridia bacterium]|nr:MBOAT family protein [Clostridia bacterium]